MWHDLTRLNRASCLGLLVLTRLNRASCVGLLVLTPNSAVVPLN